MRSNHFRVIVIALLGGLLALNGCLGGPGQAPPTRYFVLNSSHSMENKTAPIANVKGAVVGVGPIRLSQVLDRPQIIMRTSKNEIRIADLDRWAGPLHEMVANVMVENLAELLPGAEILKFPWPVTLPVTYQVAMDITQFDGTPGGTARMRSSWRILGEGTKTILANKQSMLDEPIGGNTMAEMVTAQSRLLEKLCREIAFELKELKEQRMGQ